MFFFLFVCLFQILMNVKGTHVGMEAFALIWLPTIPVIVQENTWGGIVSTVSNICLLFPQFNYVSLLLHVSSIVQTNVLHQSLPVHDCELVVALITAFCTCTICPNTQN